MTASGARRPLPAALLAAAVVAALAGAAAPADAWDEMLLLCGDYTSVGMARSAGRRAPWTVSGDLEAVPPDPVARWHTGLFYVVGRGGDSLLQVLDPRAGYVTVRQFSLGTGRNPQDIAFSADGTAFVSCYDTAELLEVDVAAGTVLRSFPTGAFADADGLPETAWLQAVGDRLYVVCQRLDRNDWYRPTGPSRLAVFDMAAEAWVDVAPGTPELDAIVLTGANPYGAPALSPDRSRLRVPCSGGWGSLDGGVDVVDLEGMTSLGLEVTEADLGGDLVALAPVDSTRVCAIVSDLSFRTRLVCYDPRPGGPVTAWASAPAYDYADLACDGASLLYLADRNAAAPGLRVFDAGSGAELTAAAVPTGLPPLWIVPPVDPALTGVEGGGPPPAARTALALGRPWPNPANPGCAIRLRGAPGGEVALAVCDLRGRRLRRSTLRLDGTGEAVWRFDGRDGAGRSLPSGLYLVRAEQGAATASRPLVLAR